MEQIHTTTYLSAIGKITLAGCGDCLIGAWWNGQKHFGSTLRDCDCRQGSLPVLTEAERWLNNYFSGKRNETMPRLRLIGTPWQLMVWDNLLKIPYGSTISYGELAARIAAENGVRVSARAVGSAVGCNPISLFVPCHRVVGANGALTGYAAGLHIKRQLLEIEGVV
ncbi:MAG: methylated-DNA--[protein]-cysteine S-methyltransferase [Muribaculaceae bacterium]